MTRYLRDSAGTDLRRAARHQHGRLLATHACATRADEFRVGYFARIAPEKGLHVLAKAYVRFRQRCRQRDDRRCRWPATWRRTHRQLSREGARRAEAGRTRRRVHVPRRARSAGQAGTSCESLDVLSVPATYDEPKGMFLLEAMACGVPVVQPRRGAFTEVVEKTGGGLLVDPDDPDALAAGLHQLWSDRALSATLARSSVRRRARALHDRAVGGSSDRGVRVGGSSRQGRSAVLNVSGVGKQYPTPRGPLTVLSDVSFTLSPGEAAAITGPSGSGKSSLLYMLGALEPPSQGTITLDGQNPFDARRRGAGRFPQHQIGFVFQDHCLLPQCTRARERARPDAGRARMDNDDAPARARACSSRWAWARGSTIGRASCPAARSSAWRLRARSSGSRVSCCATSPPATSIRRRRQPSRRCCWTFTHASATS